MVAITIKRNGIFWFKPGKEKNIKKFTNFTKKIANFNKRGIIFNGVQGLLKNGYEVYYCSNITKDTPAININIQKSFISEAVFLNTRYIAILQGVLRKLVIIDLISNKRVYEMVVYGEGFASSMSILKNNSSSSSRSSRIAISVR